MTTQVTRWVARLLTALPLAVLVSTLAAPAASAHPLGNFTVNTYNGLRVESAAVSVRMIVDSAEVPTVQRFPGATGATGVDDAQAAAFAATECARLAPGARLQVDGVEQELVVRSSDLVFVPGAAGLPTMRLSCEMRTAEPIGTAGHRIEYVDRNSLERVGWREITAVGDGVRIAESDVPATSVSEELTDYPADLLSSPLDQREARLLVVTGSGSAAGEAPAESRPSSGTGAGGLSDAFTDLVSSRDLSLGFAVLALTVSVGLGALHAFAPGHGKTLMAAYLLGQRTSLRQVAVIGLTVTLMHTTGVLVLGIVLSAVAVAAPAKIYSWLGLVSGVLLVAVGASLLRKAARAPTLLDEGAREVALAGVGHGHTHGPGHQHGHGHPHGITHSHGPGRPHTHVVPSASASASARSLVAVGLVGGMVPAPSALIVLLGGIALGRTWFGVLLVVGYGIGMALALTGTGVALAYARNHLERWTTHRPPPGRQGWALRATRALPALTALLVIAVGIGLGVRAAISLPL